MRKKVIAGNWKMNKTLAATVDLIAGIKAELENINPDGTKVEVIVCPPFTSLEAASTVVKDSPVKLGAQNMHTEDSGAYTGEISADMLKSVGVEYVILGHSERRTIFNETDAFINTKIKKALDKGLKPIFCIGETLQEREADKTEAVVEEQVRKGLAGIEASSLQDIIIAYEPVWAIGTGKTASPEQAQEVHAFIRNLVKELYSENEANDMVIQYGGSMKPENAAELLSQPDIDGGLIGGAALKSDSFAGIIKAAM